MEMYIYDDIKHVTKSAYDYVHEQKQRQNKNMARPVQDIQINDMKYIIVGEWLSQLSCLFVG